MPVDCAAAGIEIAQATSAMHPISHGIWRLIWRIMEASKNNWTLVYFFLFVGSLLVVERLNRVQACGFHGGIDTRNEPDRHRDRECKSQRPAADDGGPTGKAGDHAGHRGADDQAKGAAGGRDQRRLHDELADDVGPPRANRAPDADLAGPLEHADEHDVHDADAADEQRDRRERDHDDVEDALGALLFGEQLSRNDERVVVGAAMRRSEDAAHGRGGGQDVGLRLQPQVDAVDLVAELTVVVFEPEHRRAGRHVERIVAILSGDAGDVALRDRLAAGYADHAVPLRVDLDEAI